jgi:hypothetical protein
LLLAVLVAFAWVGYQRPGLLMDLARLPFC